MSNLYRGLIAEATGESDQEILDEIEEIMRHSVFRSTLDWIPREQFFEGARTAADARIALIAMEADLL